MSVTALFRGKWGQKSQEAPDKHLAAVAQPNCQVNEDEDDSNIGFSREPIRRNSRFYRSMRKKRLVQAEQTESKKILCHLLNLLALVINFCVVKLA